jgi:Methyltransferase domain
MALRSLIPRRIKSHLREMHRAATLRKALAESKRCVQSELPISTELADRLFYGWSNEGWSAKTNLVEYLVNHNLHFTGTFLECGSGLSTVLMSQIAQKTGAKIFSLEHHPEWHTRMRATLSDMGLQSGGVLLTPLTNYGDFDWYAETPELASVSSIDLILCDGPPSNTLGGRYGLFQRIFPKLAPRARIVVDDSHREYEQKLLKRWLIEYAGKIEIESAFSTFTVLRLI